MEYISFRENKLSRLCFGCSRLGKSIAIDTTSYGEDILDQAHKAGINFFDTASNYSYGDSEKILGKWAKHKEKVYLTTKGGSKLSSKALLAQYVRPLFKFIRPIVKQSKKLKKNRKRSSFDFDYLIQTFETSKKRLGKDKIFLYQYHNPSDDVLESDKSNQFLGKLKASGAVKFTGYALNTIGDILKVKHLEHIDVIQIPLNYYNYREEYFQALKNLKSKGILIIARTPFGRGLLTQNRTLMTGSAAGDIDENFNPIIDRFKKLYGYTETEMALWFLKQMNLADVILFSSFNSDHLNENVHVFNKEVPDSFDWKLLTSQTPKNLSKTF